MHSAVEASSLSDILFFLMLFFLMISTMASPEAIKVLLPKSSTGKVIPKHAVSVTIDKDLHWFVEGVPVDNTTIETSLKASAVKYNNDVTVVLKLDKDISVQEMMKVVDVVNKLNMPLVVATDRPK